MARRAAGSALLVSAVALGTAAPAAAVGESVTVTPDRNLADTAFVDVSGTGFSANATVLMYQCADVGSVKHCSDELLAEVDVDSRGAFGPVTVTVHAAFTTDLGPTDCRTGCHISAVELPGTRSGQGGISFSRYSSTK